VIAPKIRVVGRHEFSAADEERAMVIANRPLMQFPTVAPISICGWA
jgi:hypothetical protein